MELQINNQLVQLPPGTYSIQEVLDERHPHHQEGIAVAVNQSVIPKKQWSTYRLEPHDKILLITATQGG